MTDSTDDSQKQNVRRPLMFVVLGIFLFSAAGWLINDRLRVHTTIPIPQVYEYNVKQGIDHEVHYRQSSFYKETPGPVNTAYIANLTDYISARFHYDFRANEPTNLTYDYDASAVVRGTYGSADSNIGLSNVWTKQFQLLEPTSGTQQAANLSLEPEVQIPFAEYRKVIGQFKVALDVPVNSELVVTYHVKVSGTVHGTPFEDSQVMTITAPLDQQIYRLGVKYTKADHHEVASKQSQKLEDIITRYELPVAVLLVILGFAYTVYGFRRQIIKSPYQRKLERIYRYHDGIIIRASRPTNLTGKNIVVVKNFDDLLNLEEEIKSPIVASEVSDATTHFFITRDDIVYVYTLGEQVPFKPANNSSDDTKPQPPKQPPKPRKVMG